MNEEVIPDAQDTNLDEVYEARTAGRRKAELDARLDRLISGEFTPEAPAEAPQQTQGEQGEESTVQAIQRNFSPTEFFGGGLDALDENFNTLRLLSEKGNEFLMESIGIPGMIVDEDGSIRFTTDAGELNATDDFGGMLPDMGDTERGGFARGLGQFTTNFLGLGKAFKAMGAIQGSGAVATAANSGLRSALSTFAGFEGMDNPVNGLVQAFPSLEGDITEFLDSDAEDPELLNKLRTGMLDLGAGAMVDTAIGGLRALRGIGNQAKPLLKAAETIDEATKHMDEVKGTFKDLIGDVESPDLIVRSDAPEGMARAAIDGADGEADDVFVNWARIDSSDDVKQLIQDLADADAPNINAARRGVRSNEVTELAADEVDAWTALQNRRQGTPMNAEETLAARKLWTSSGRKTMELAQAVKSGGGVPEQVAFRKMLAVHATIQEQVIAARTETARALQQWRIPAGEVADFSVAFDDLFKQVELDPTTRQLAEGLSTLNAMGGSQLADQFVYANGRLGKLAKFGAHASEIVTQLYYGSMLSGLHTQMRNIIGNTGMMGLNVAERKLAYGIGRSLGDEQVASSEAGAMMFGMVQGARDAFRISAKSRKVAEMQGRTAGGFVDALKTGDSGFGIGKVDTGRVGALSAERLKLDPDSAWGRGADFIDTATQSPTRMLGAMDEVFKTSNFRAEIMAQAHRKAQKELSEGIITREAFQDRVTTLVNDPDQFAKIAAQEQAQIATFTSRPKDTKTWKAMRAVSQIPVFGKLVLPFSGTPYNIAIESIERMPVIAGLSKKWREELMAGGARTDIALAKMGMGSMFLAAAGDLAANGYLTGDMQSMGAEREQRARLGERSMTVRVDVPWDDTDQPRTFSFRGLDPLTFSLGIAANTFEILSDDDFSDANKDAEDVAVAAILAIGAQFASANYMSGVSDFFDAMSDPKRYGESYFERLASVAAPAIVGQASRSMDPTMREATTMWEAVIAKTPWSTGLAARRDAWGRPLTRESGLGKSYDVISPIYSAQQDVAPVDEELQRLGAAIGKPSRVATFEGVNVDLKKFPYIYSRYQEIQGLELTDTVDGAPVVVGAFGYVNNGKPMVEELNDLVSGNHPSSAIYELGTDGREGDKATMIRQIVTEYRKQARRQILEEFPELKAEVESRSDERPQRNFGSSAGLQLFGN